MAKYLLMVESNCTDATREAEFNEWYNKVHLPDLLETPGYIRATRYENIEPSVGRGKFLAAYEIEADDIGKVMKAQSENLAKKRAEGRFSELLMVVSRAIYRQVSTLSK